MQLCNVRQYGKEGLWNVSIENHKQVTIAPHGNRGEKAGINLDCDGALCLPGFINSHDHLDFNCYRRLGNGRYNNYREWGMDIHSSHAVEIAQVSKIPSALRVKWGMYKNLLNGFTTVVNHGEKLNVDDAFIRVIQDFPSVHSVGFGKNWKWTLRDPFSRKMIVMHVGEGKDAIAANEIDELARSNIFRRKIVGVHGIRMTVEQTKNFEALVWCPSSNYFLFGETADIPSLLGKVDLVFGTDSTLTSTWNAWKQFREAMGSGLVTEEALVDMLTTRANELWKLERTANLVLIKSTTQLFGADPRDIMLVINDGRIMMIDEDLSGQISVGPAYFPISLEGRKKWVYGDLPSLTKQILTYYPGLEVPFQLQ